MAASAAQVSQTGQVSTGNQVQTIVVQQTNFNSNVPQDWKYGILNCCSAGFLGCLFCVGCPCVNYACATSKLHSNKNLCCELIKACIFPCCCSQCMREEVRTNYNIKGNHCGDRCCVCWCYPCAGVQMHAEVKSQNLAKLNQNNTVTVVQQVQQPIPQQQQIQAPIQQQGQVHGTDGIAAQQQMVQTEQPKVAVGVSAPAEPVQSEQAVNNAPVASAIKQTSLGEEGNNNGETNNTVGQE